MTICSNCIDTDGCVGVVTYSKRSKSHQDHLMELHRRKRIREPTDYDTVVHVDCRKFPDGLVGYFAASPQTHSDFLSCSGAVSAEEAYRGAQYGSATFKGHRLTIKLLTPQCYIEDGKLWPRHLHFCYLEGSNRQLFTVVLHPGVNGSVTVRCVSESPYACIVQGDALYALDPGCAFLGNPLPTDSPNLSVPGFSSLRIPFTETPDQLKHRLQSVSPSAPIVVCTYGDHTAAKKSIQALRIIGYHRILLLELHGSRKVALPPRRMSVMDFFLSKVRIYQRG